MNGGAVFACVAASLALLLLCLCLLRVGGEAEYSAEGVLVRVRIGPCRVTVFPVRQKKKKAGGRPPKNKQESSEEKKSGSLRQVRRFLPLVGEAAGELKHRIRIDTLCLTLTAGGEDPAMAAMAFGTANMVFGMLWPVFEQNFDMGEHWFQAAVDFNASHTTLYGKAAFSARVGQLVSFGVRFGWKAFQLIREGRKEALIKKEAI